MPSNFKKKYYVSHRKQQHQIHIWQVNNRLKIQIFDYISRISITFPSTNLFDIRTDHEHVETPDNLKVALIQQKELSADHSGQTIFDVEMAHFEGSKAAATNYIKVIQNYGVNKLDCDRYSCKNITTTLIQISRLFYFGFFSKTNHQMII